MGQETLRERLRRQKYRYRAWRHDRARNAELKALKRHYHIAMRRESDPQQKDAVTKNYWARRQFVEEGARGVEYIRLRHKAYKYGIPIKDEWKDEQAAARADLMFTRKGEFELRHLIQKARRERIEWWVKVVGPPVAIIVGMIGWWFKN